MVKEKRIYSSGKESQNMINDFSCKWLPDLLYKESYESDNKYLERLYKIFEESFKRSQPIFKGEQVGCRKNPITHGYEEGFFHLTHRDYKNAPFQDRGIDYFRCERFEWIKKIIENYNCTDSCCTHIKVWEEKKKTYLLFEEVKYVVILEKRKGYYVVVTAFYIDYNHTMNKLLNKYKKSKDRY